MTYSYRIFLVTACLTFATSAPLADTAHLVKVNNVAIPAKALEQALTEARIGGQPDTPELRTLLTQRLIAEELFWQEAKKQNLHNSPAATAAANQARRRYAIGQYIQDSIKPPTPDEAELHRHYDRIVASLGPREYRVSLIQTANEAALRDAAQRISGGADFASEARRISQAPSSQRGGAINWLSFPVPPVAGHTNGLPVPIAQAILTLKLGAISAPISVDNTWALVRLDDERATQVPDFQTIKATLIQTAQTQSAASAGRDLALRLIKNARIEGNPTLTPSSGAQQ